MRLSLIIPTLDSHEMVRRQLLYYEREGLPDGDEIILVDDGSRPPLEGSLPGLTIHRTNDFRPWTQCHAMNAGAVIAKGQFLIQSAIDHIVTPALMEACLSSRFKFLRFKREVAVLDEFGRLTQDLISLQAYGWPLSRYPTRSLRLPPHSGIYFIEKDIYWRIGGTPEDRRTYPQREEATIRRKIDRLVAAGELERYGDEDRPMLYMVPNGKYCGHADYNPFGLFHRLSRNGNELAHVLSQPH
jgi:hypothetical protein